MFHLHQWEIMATTYVPPVLKAGMHLVDVYNIPDLLTPHTYVTQRCKACGKLQQHEFKGEVNFNA